MKNQNSVTWLVTSSPISLSPIQDYSTFNYLDIDVDATLELTNAPENIGLNQENPGTTVRGDKNYFYSLYLQVMYVKYNIYFFTGENDNIS